MASGRVTAKGLNPFRAGVHPALQLAYPSFGTWCVSGTMGILGNNRRKRAIKAARDLDLQEY